MFPYCKINLKKIFFWEKFQPLYSEKLINLSNQYGVTPLHYACYFANRRVVDLILDLDGDINIKDNDGNTSLHYAVNSNCQRTVKKLLIRGADKNIRNNEGKTPYDISVETNHLNIANLVEIKNFFKKYICMENELTEFKKTRNDRILLTTMVIIFTIKLIYTVKFITSENMYCKGIII